MISQRRILIPHKLTPQSIIIPAHLSKQYSSGHHLSNYHFIRYHYFLSKYPLTHYHLYLSKYPLIHYYHWYLSKYHPIHYYHWYLAKYLFFILYIITGIPQSILSYIIIDISQSIPKKELMLHAHDRPFFNATQHA